jgi:ribose-phosphate pyrophosphokinase
VTHALLNEEGLERLGAAEYISGIVVTDTVPIASAQQPDNLTILSVSGLLAETIMNVFADDSVSAIFGGENQLF